MSRDPWTGQRLEAPDCYRTYYARCSVCEETFEEDDMAEIEHDYLGPEDLARGRCKWCPKEEEPE